MFITPEHIQHAIDQRIETIEKEGGDDASFWYKVGFLECLNFLTEMKLIMEQTEFDEPITGGIN